MEGTVAFRPEDTPKNEFVVFGAGHEVQSTLDIPPAPPGGRLLVVLDAIPLLSPTLLSRPYTWTPVLHDVGMHTLALPHHVLHQAPHLDGPLPG